MGLHSKQHSVPWALINDNDDSGDQYAAVFMIHNAKAYAFCTRHQALTHDSQNLEADTAQRFQVPQELIFTTLTRHSRRYFSLTAHA